jgi:hypothetical protein
MNRRAFLKGLLSTTAVVAVPSSSLDWLKQGEFTISGVDLAKQGDDFTALTLHWQEQIVSVTQIPARMLFGGAQSADDYYAYVSKTLEDHFGAQYPIRPFPSEVQNAGGEEDKSIERTRQEAWQWFAEFAQRRRRWQAQQERSHVATVQINGGGVK